VTAYCNLQTQIPIRTLEIVPEPVNRFINADATSCIGRLFFISKHILPGKLLGEINFA
jgi:hypothetical protein